MVIRTAFLLTVLALFVMACGGGSDDSPAGTPTRTPSSTASPANTPSGPRADVSPNSGPPGVEVTITGSGWEPGVLIDLTGQLAPGTSADPYDTVMTAADGSFTARFRLETAPDGSALDTGRYNLIARSPANQVTIPFLVETRRPISGSGPAG